jgi:hypothetical protein
VFFDRSMNPWINKHLNLSADWYPPARWVSHPVARAASLGEPVAVD